MDITAFIQNSFTLWTKKSTDNYLYLFLYSFQSPLCGGGGGPQRGTRVNIHSVNGQYPHNFSYDIPGVS